MTCVRVGATWDHPFPGELATFERKTKMRNPWMSIYLSAANRAAGAARGQIMSEAARQQTAAGKAAASQIKSFWLGSPVPPKKKRKNKPRG